MTDLSKFQKFETKTIARSMLADAPYNPRQIDDENRRKLRRALKDHGLVMPLVWNKRTGNLVAGHQRISILDSLERSQDYTLTVAVIDVPAREEKLLNVQLNNPGMMGDWDADKLVAMVKADDLDWVDELGFSVEDVNFIAGLDAMLDDDTDEMQDAKDKMTNITELRAGVREKHRTTDKDRTDYYFTVVCESPAHKEKLLAMIGVDEGDDLVPGRAIERLIRAVDVLSGDDEDARDEALKQVDEALGAPPESPEGEDDDLNLEVTDDDE